MARGQAKNKKTSGGELTLPDGTKIPLGIPPGVPPEVAKAVIKQLQENPEQAKLYMEQAKAIASDKTMTQAYMNMFRPKTDDQQKIFEALSGDPEFKEILDDIKANGHEAMHKYLDDQELMVKVSQKLRESGLSPAAQQAAASAGQNGDAASKEPKPKAQPTDNLFEAAKAGDAKAALQLIKGGADVNAVNEKGVTALGVAVGFSQRNVVELLLEHGADIQGTDKQGNSPLHYAAGYGRRELAEVLVRAGADVRAKNKQGHSPIDVASLNGEKVMAGFLQAREKLQTKMDKNKEKPEVEVVEAAPATGLAGLSESELAKLSVEEIDAMLSQLST